MTDSIGAPPFGGERVITLGGECFEKKVAIHEMMHAVGFFHEMSRRDRDTFIYVNYNNMVAGKEVEVINQLLNFRCTKHIRIRSLMTRIDHVTRYIIKSLGVQNY